MKTTICFYILIFTVFGLHAEDEHNLWLRNKSTGTRFTQVQSKLRSQSMNSQICKDACLLYFQQFNNKPIPYDIERPVHDLDDLIKNDMSR